MIFQRRLSASRSQQRDGRPPFGAARHQTVADDRPIEKERKG
jgi:hypothetical protein